MGLFRKLFLFAIYYSLVIECYVFCRISNERKCVDSKCSVPISVATTLIRYNADDDRLLSFKRNVKAKVFSKEAGDKPNFWEIEDDISKTCSNDIWQVLINGKRGYAPKNLLREEKMLVKNNAVKVIVPTGRVDKTQKNLTQENLKSKSANLAETPELPVANSKGFFSMMGEVSADSVPMSAPDINPQPAKSIEVVDGTTLIYDDHIGERPPKAVPETKEMPAHKDIPSQEIKTPVEKSAKESSIVNKYEDVEEIVAEEEEITLSESEQLKDGTEERSGKEKIVAENTELDIETQLDEDKSKQSLKTNEKLSDQNEGTAGDNSVEVNKLEIDVAKSSGPTSEPSIISNLYSSVSHFISSGTGESVLEEDEEKDEESSGEEENEEGGEIFSGEEENEKGKVLSGEEEKHVDETPERLSKDMLESPNKENANDSQKGPDTASESPSLPNVTLNQSSRSDNKIIGLESGEVESTLKSDETTGVTAEEDKKYLSGEESKEVDNNETKVAKEEAESISNNVSSTDTHYTPEEEVKTSGMSVSSQNTTSESNLTDSVEDKENLYDFTDNQELKTIKPETANTLKHNIDVLEADQENNSSEVTVPVDSATDTNTSAPTIDENIVLDTTGESAVRYNSEEVSEVVSEGSQMKPAYESSEIQPDTEIPGTEQASVRGLLFGSSQFKHDSPEKPEGTIGEAVQSEVPPVLSIPAVQPQNIVDVHGSDPSSTTPKPDMVQGEAELPVKSSEVIQANDSVYEEKSERVVQTESQSSQASSPEVVSQTESIQEISTKESFDKETESPLQDTPVLEEISTDGEIIEDIPSEPAVPTEPSDSEGILSWLNPVFDLFASFGSTQESIEKISSVEDAIPQPDSLDPHIKDESCLAGEAGEAACETLGDVPILKQLTWQDSLYSADMSATLDLLDRVPLEATIWLIVTAVVVLIFSLGHYYIEAHRRDGPLVAVINKLERDVLILKKEGCILQDKLAVAEEQLEAWNTNSSENDALIVELKQELEETKAAKAELEDQVVLLEREVETVTESGMEMHRLLEESLSSQDGSQVLLSTVETLREKLERQENEIAGLSNSLSIKNVEVEELKNKLAKSAEVANSLEERIITITRDKEEEALKLKDKQRQLVAQLEEVIETKALDETRVSTEITKLRLMIEELQKSLAEKDAELEEVKEVVKQLRSTDSNDKMDALFDVVGVRARLKATVTERDEFREKFQEEEGARKLLEGHMKKITQEVEDLKNRFETAEKEKIEALTKLQVLSNYFKEKESQLQKELGLQESMWLQKQSDDHTIYEQMRSLREENEKYKLQNESLKKEIVEQESSFKIQLANAEQKAHENWVTSRQAERRLKEVQQEASQLRNKLTMEKNTTNYSSLDDSKQNISESNGDPSSPPPPLMFPPTTSPPFMMYPMPPPGDFMPPPPLMGSPYPSDSRPPPLGRISSPPLDHRFSPPPPLPYPPYDYPPYGHHSPSPPPPMQPHSHHRNVHKPQPREMTREQKDHGMSTFPQEADKTVRRTKR